MRQLLYIDLFCGAGGTSTGVERAMYKGNKCAEVIACVNHDPNAIASHAPHRYKLRGVFVHTPHRRQTDQAPPSPSFPLIIPYFILKKLYFVPKEDKNIE